MTPDESAVVQAFQPRGLLGVRAFRGLLWLLVLSGPVIAGWVATQAADLSRDLVSVTRGVATPGPSTAAAEGFAELAIADLLRNEREEPARAGGSATTWPDLRTVSVGADEVAPGYFAVTVAVESPGTSGADFYTIGVASTAAGLVVTAPPSLVAAPVALPAPTLAVGRLGGLDEVVELGDALQGFLDALLVGTGDVSRYADPRASIRAVTPAPFSSVEIVSSGSVPWLDGTRLVVVELEGLESAGPFRSLSYSIVMTERDGRWEVADLLAAPPLAAHTGND